MSKWDKLEQTLKRKSHGLELRRNEHMSEHTFFHLGGPVALMALPKSSDEVMDAIHYAYQQHIGAMMSKEYTEFVVNVGGATCTDFLELVRQVREIVLVKTGVELEMGIEVLGE